MGYDTRLSREETGRTDPIIPTDQDLAFLKVLFDHGHTPSDMLNARVRPGKGQKYATSRLMELERHPNAYVYRHPAQHYRRMSHARYLFHDLTAKGIALLIERGVITAEEAAWRRKLKGRGQPNQFFHDALAYHLTNSIALGAGDAFLPSFRATAKAPQSIREGRRPLFIKEFGFSPDEFFALRYASAYRFFSVESDMASVPANRLKAGSSAFRKFAIYGQIYESGIYKTHYGIPSMLVLVLTTSERHRDSMMRVLRQAAGERSWKRAVLFRHTVNPRDGALPATDYLYREPWKTLDGTFDISKL